MTTVAEPAKAASVTTSATTILTVTVDENIACWRCKKYHMEKAARPWEYTCPKCHAKNCSKPVD